MKKKRRKANRERDRKEPAAELDILRQRALGRAVLEDTSGGPDLSIVFAKEGGGVSEAHSATVQFDGEDREYFRDAGESQSEFEQRINRDLPVGAHPLIVFWPDAEP